LSQNEAKPAMQTTLQQAGEKDESLCQEEHEQFPKLVNDGR
jgi:hypothetical protein